MLENGLRWEDSSLTAAAAAAVLVLFEDGKGCW